MNDPMTILKADHREAKALLAKLSESEEGAERDQMVRELTEALQLHMQLEENLVYPLVASNLGEEDREEADVEHGLARDGLQKLNELTEKPGFGAAVEMLKAGIEHHVKEEETEILPELKTSLPREEWLALGDAIASAKAEAGKPVPASSSNGRRSSKRKSRAGSRR